MLAEIVLSPSLFDGDAADCVEVLESLRGHLLPQSGVSPFVVCNLGHWKKSVLQRLCKQPNTTNAQKARALFTLIDQQLLVSRNDQSPTKADESAWVAAAVESHRLAALDGVLTADDYEEELAISIKGANRQAFFESFENPRTISRTCSSQEPALRTLCMHSDWLLIRMPFIKGGSTGDEIVTVKQILKLVNSRVVRDSRCEIIIQIDNSYGNPYQIK